MNTLRNFTHPVVVRQIAHYEAVQYRYEPVTLEFMDEFEAAYGRSCYTNEVKQCLTIMPRIGYRMSEVQQDLYDTDWLVKDNTGVITCYTHALYQELFVVA